jgi:hypothetical protein
MIVWLVGHDLRLCADEIGMLYFGGKGTSMWVQVPFIRCLMNQVLTTKLRRV